MTIWRPIKASDREEYLAMADAFYHTDGVIRPVPCGHLEAGFDELMRSDQYAYAYICQADGDTVGYALIAKTFSQEAGGIVLWVEELFIKDGYRDKGLGKAFFEHFFETLPADVKRVRLETERGNDKAVRLYKSLGFEFLEYDQMILEQ